MVRLCMQVSEDRAPNLNPLGILARRRSVLAHIRWWELEEDRAKLVPQACGCACVEVVPLLADPGESIDVRHFLRRLPVVHRMVSTTRVRKGPQKANG